MAPIEHFWNLSPEELFKAVGSSIDGLSEREAMRRLQLLNKSSSKTTRWLKDLVLWFSQFKSPLVILLLFAVILSFVLKEYTDAVIVFIVLFLTGLLGFIQERSAGQAVEKLRAIVHNKAAVKRGQTEVEMPFEAVVPGDVIFLNAGDMIPADALVIASNDLHVNESLLTGESYPVEKSSSATKTENVLLGAKNAVFKGSSVINGAATVVAVNTGEFTEFGRIAASLERPAPITAFQKGINEFGALLLRLTFIITCVILVLNVSLHKSFVDSILFALAIAVGLTPELLPAIVTITLSAGAKRLAAQHVIVKKLSAIENLGHMNILCSDKTGTLTEGKINVQAAVDVDNVESDKVLLYAYLNSLYETGFNNPIDEAIRGAKSEPVTGYLKLAEVPYDFIRKRLSVVVGTGNESVLITKGSVESILEICVYAEGADGTKYPVGQVMNKVTKQFEAYGNKGYRSIAVCYKDVTGDTVINKDVEKGMTLLGLIILSDPPKKGIIGAIHELAETGVQLKIISGDHHLVTRNLAMQIGISVDELLKGKDLLNMTDDVLAHKVRATAVFAEILPAQKERIIKALQSMGNVVGYLGDGINDANALQTADIGISIENAVDVAKDAADIVLLDHSIDVIRQGVIEGRKTFRNTLKYIFVTTSANFGNMFSMVVASFVLPFLPLMPFQILLNNFLSDLPAIAIASDKVDKELISKPLQWNMHHVKRFMIIFGLQSSIFDLATFALLIGVFHTSIHQFRTAWFMESLLTEIVILLVIRTNRAFFRSRPSNYLIIASLVSFCFCFFIPYLPVASLLQLYPLPFHLLISVILIIVVYVVVAETSKRFLFSWIFRQRKSRRGSTLRRLSTYA